LSITTPGTGTVPARAAAQILGEVRQQSAALALGTKMPMSTADTDVPVPKAFPSAAFVSGPGGRKPFTDLQLSSETMTAEEIAAVVAIPDSTVEDDDIDLWAYTRPLLAEAIAIAFDNAVFWGIGAPATYPAGGIAADAITVPQAASPVLTVSNAMSAVEAEGLAVTGSAADTSVEGAFRGMTDANGALLLGAMQVDQSERTTLFGRPIYYTQFAAPAVAGDPTATPPVAAVPGSTGDFITGAWRYLLIGVRQDIRFEFSKEGVLANADGTIAISAFQDNQTLLKVWARFGCVLVNPVTPRNTAGAKPFAITEVASTPVP